MIKRIYFLIIVAILMMMSIQPSSAANAVVGTGTPASCTEAAFESRIEAMLEEQRPYALGIYANAVVSKLALTNRSQTPC